MDAVPAVPGHLCGHGHHRPDLHPGGGREYGGYAHRRAVLRKVGAYGTVSESGAAGLYTRAYPGEYPVYLYYKEHKRMTLAPKEYWVADDEELYMRLAQLLGSENISIKD